MRSVFGPSEAEVVLDIGNDRELAAVVTSQSLRDMELPPGKQVLAAFKATHSLLAVED